MCVRISVSFNSVVEYHPTTPVNITNIALINIVTFSCSNLLLPDEVRTEFGFLTNATMNDKVNDTF